jgi:molybdopterin/thiamine biosynthesis adenylyltransferase
MRINDVTRDRYHSLAISSVWRLDVVRGLRALVVGAGALGNEVAKNLAMMGVRLIVVLDRDTVEVSNLTRSVFFRESDHGRPKAEVMAAQLRALNPDVEVLPLVGNVDEVLGLGLLRRVDAVFSCLDNRLARRSVNRMCQKLAKPWVDGSMENLLGDVTVFMPDAGPCYECTLTRGDREAISQAVLPCGVIARRNISLNRIPTISTMGSIIGALQVQEALRVVHGEGAEAELSKKIVVNCGINDFYVTRASRREPCDGHFRYGEVTEVPSWGVEGTSAADVLERFRADTGGGGHLRLGRDIVIGLSCGRCGVEEVVGEPLTLLSVERATCETCGEVREPRLTNVVRGDETYASWPLRRLGIPPLDVLEARGGGRHVWYEFTGDLRAFPAALSAAEPAGEAGE